MKIHATDHAVQRFQERVRPTLDLPAARRELLRLTKGCALEARPPAWKHSDPRESSKRLWAELSDGIAAVLTPRGTIVTVVERSGSPEAHRANKNEDRARRRRAHKAKTRNRHEGRPRIEAEAWPI